MNTTEISCVTVLEARSLKSSCRHDCTPTQDLRGPSIPAPSIFSWLPWHSDLRPIQSKSVSMPPLFCTSVSSPLLCLFHKDVCMSAKSLVSDSFVTPWTVALQAPLSMGFSRQEYWSGLPCPPPGDLPHPRTEPGSLRLLNWQVYSLPLAPLRKLHMVAVRAH